MSKIRNSILKLFDVQLFFAIVRQELRKRIINTITIVERYSIYAYNSRCCLQQNFKNALLIQLLLSSVIRYALIIFAIIF